MDSYRAEKSAAMKIQLPDADAEIGPVPASGGDPAYRNAQAHSDRQNARIEHDKALGRVMTSLLKDDTELFKQFSDNESFRR